MQTHGRQGKKRKAASDAEKAKVEKKKLAHEEWLKSVEKERDMFLGKVGGGRKTIDGLQVYTPDELGVKADSGGTPQCPFECECCH